MQESWSYVVDKVEKRVAEGAQETFWVILAVRRSKITALGLVRGGLHNPPKPISMLLFSFPCEK